MGKSRVQKFQDYRNSLIKEGAPILETPENNNSNAKNYVYETTSTLPIDEVINALDKEDDEAVFIKKAKQRQILFYSLIGAGLLIVIAGIIVFAILVFR